MDLQHQIRVEIQRQDLAKLHLVVPYKVLVEVVQLQVLHSLILEALALVLFLVVEVVVPEVEEVQEVRHHHGLVDMVVLHSQVQLLVYQHTMLEGVMVVVILIQNIQPEELSEEVEILHQGEMELPIQVAAVVVDMGRITVYHRAVLESPLLLTQFLSRRIKWHTLLKWD